MKILGSEEASGRLYISVELCKADDFAWKYLRNWQGNSDCPAICPSCESEDIYSLRNYDDLGYPSGNWWWCHNCKSVFAWKYADCPDCHWWVDYVDEQHCQCPRCKADWETQTIISYYKNEM